MYCDKSKENYPKYENFINNYFIKYKKSFFERGDYDYEKLAEDCKSNSVLDNYNKYLKNKLGKSV